MRRLSPAIRTLVSLALVVGGVGAVGVATAGPAAAATWTVNTLTDAPAASCSDPTLSAPTSPLSLRDALCRASNAGGGQVVIVPAGTYQLTAGELTAGFLSGSSLFITGAGPSTTRIVGVAGPTGSRVLDLDPDIVGGVTVTIDGVTITGGRTTTFGGAGIIGGSGFATLPDALTVQNSVISNNATNGAGPQTTNQPGGGIQFIGGSLTLTNVAVSENTSGGSPGAGVYFQQTSASNKLTVENSVFSNNQLTNNSGVYSGGAGLFVGSSSSTASTITGSTFAGNTASGASELRGGAIFATGGLLTVTKSTVRTNSLTSGTAAKGAGVYVGGGTATLQYNRFGGNSANSTASGVAQEGGASVDATDNWWGCNAGPGNSGCDGTTGTVASNPRLVLTHTASPASIATAGTSTLTATFAGSDGSVVSAANLAALVATSISFGNPVLGTLSGSQSTVQSNGTATSTFTAGSTGGTGSADVTYDNQTVTASIGISGDTAPQVTTNPANQTVSSGDSVSFSAAATGSPTPTVQWQVSTNGGASYTNVPGATSTTLSFTAAASDDGKRFRAVFTNSVGSATSTAATLSINQAPTVTLQPQDADAESQQQVSFSSTAIGTPAPTVQWQESTDGGSTWLNIPGATSTTYTFTVPLAADDAQYRAVFTNSSGTATSNAATLHVLRAVTTQTVTVADNSVVAGDIIGVTFARTNSGDAPEHVLGANYALPYWPGVSWTGPNDCSVIDTGTFYFVNCVGSELAPGASESWKFTSGTTTASCGTIPIKDSSNGDITVSCLQDQTISWDTTIPSGWPYGASFAVAASATSGLPVTITTSGPCTYASSTGLVTITSGFGTCTINADQAGGSGYAPAPTLTASVTAERRKVFVSVSPDTVQYSDVLPDLAANYVVSGLVSPDTLTGTLTCTAPTVSLGAGNVVLSPAGQYRLSCSGLSGSNYEVRYTTSYLTVTKEDASVGYTGQVFVAASSASATSAPIALSALVQQADDGHPGDLTKATVDFLLYKSTNTTMASPDVAVLGIPVSSAGLASASTTVPLDTYTVVVQVSPSNGYYTGPRSEPQVVTVFAPVTGKWATGGGWVHDPSPTVSAGNDHGNFGFSVRYKKGSTSPQGQSVFVWRGTDGYDYIVKSTSWNGGGAAFGPTTAGFSGKATVIVLDPSTGLSVSGLGGGNFTYRVDVVDGSTDRYAISVYTPQGALYHRAGTATAPLALGGGNITIHGS